jgi:hypothetical protein
LSLAFWFADSNFVCMYSCNVSTLFLHVFLQRYRRPICIFCIIAVTFYEYNVLHRNISVFWVVTILFQVCLLPFKWKHFFNIVKVLTLLNKFDPP